MPVPVVAIGIAVGASAIAAAFARPKRKKCRNKCRSMLTNGHPALNMCISWCNARSTKTPPNKPYWDDILKDNLDDEEWIMDELDRGGDKDGDNGKVEEDNTTLIIVVVVIIVVLLLGLLLYLQRKKKG